MTACLLRSRFTPVFVWIVCVYVCVLCMHSMCICMWLCFALHLCVVIPSSGWETQLPNLPPAPNIASVCIPPMITHTERVCKRETEWERERESSKRHSVAFNLCKAGTYVWDHTVLLHGSAPCKRHGCSWMCGLIRSPLKTPLMVDVVCGLTLAFPQRDLDTT